MMFPERKLANIACGTATRAFGEVRLEFFRGRRIERFGRTITRQKPAGRSWEGAIEIAAKIRELGFKRWYERQLIESHAYLVTCFLSMIAVAVTLEVPSLMKLGFETLVRLVVAFGGIALCILAWNQYRKRMLLADVLGEVATCTSCQTYAAFNVVGSGTHMQSADEYDFWMRVRCRKCGHEWTMGEY